MKSIFRPIVSILILSFFLSGCAYSEWLTAKEEQLSRRETEKLSPEPERIRLSQAAEKFPAEYQDAIAKTAVWFVKPGDDPSDWFIDIRQEHDSRLAIYMAHISGVEKVAELKKQGQFLLGNPSGRDGRCTYDLVKKELSDCGLGE